MNRAEQDALETAEHLKRHSFVAKTERRVDELEAYLDGRRNSAHVREVQRIMEAGIRCLKSEPALREEACWTWHIGLDEDLDMFMPQTRKLISKLFEFV